MPEETQNGQEELVTEEVKTQGEEQPEDLSTSKEPTDEVQEETQELELPEDAKERTKREFEKLKEHNKQLAEENKKLKGQSQPIPSVLDYPGFDVPQVSQEIKQQYMQPVAMPQFYPQTYQPQQPSQRDLVDEQGYVNADVLNKRLEASDNAVRRAEEAERRAIEAQQRIARFEQDNETKALYQAYPELDPLNSEVFNRDAYELVRNELTSQIVSTGKRNAIEAANKMSKYFRKEKPNTQLLEQRKAVTSVTGSQPRQPIQTDLDDLRLASRNNPNAVAERLRRLGM